MKKKILIAIGLLIAVLIITGEALFIKNLSVQLTKIQNVNGVLIHNVAILKDNIIKSWKIEHSKLNSDNILDETDRKLDIKNLNLQSPILIFRFSKVDCSDCVIKQIDLINKLQKNIKVKYLMVCDYSNKRDLGFFKRTNKITSTIYNCDKLVDNETTTTYFCIYTDGSISNVFFPDDDFPELTESYFKEISEKYFINK